MFNHKYILYTVKPCFLDCNQGQETSKCWKSLRYIKVQIFEIKSGIHVYQSV